MTRLPLNSRIAALIKQHQLVALAGAIVIALWSACFVVSLWRAWCGPRSPMETFGQFGDTFGTVNALFTGIALVGVAFTVRLQLEQLEAQREELRRQARDSQENRRALLRQEREQFLTARINATNTLLQAQIARSKYFETGDHGFVKDESVRELRKLRQQVLILFCEANLGFNPDEKSESLERRTIREYLLLFFQELLYRCTKAGVVGSLTQLEPNRNNTNIEMDILCDQIRDRHPTIATLIKDHMQNWKESLDREEVEKFIQKTLDSFLNKASYHWRQANHSLDE